MPEITARATSALEFVGGNLLLDLVEYEGCSRITAVANSDAVISSIAPVFGHLDYLFFGRSPSTPTIWVAGGITSSGVSVTGSGADPASAFFGIAGEIAEAALCPVVTRQFSAAITIGYGADAIDKKAENHAIREVVERHCCEGWWRGAYTAKTWPTDEIHFAVARTFRGRHARRIVQIIEIAAPPSVSVVIALSVEHSAMEMCFGAACRTTPQEAAGAALLEMVQGEVGLEIARMKLARFGASALSDADRLAIRHSETVRLNLRPEREYPGGNPPELCITTQSFGKFEEKVHVSCARSAVPLPDRYNLPVSELPLYK